MTSKSQSEVQKYDLVGPTSYRGMTLWAQSATEPNQLQNYDLGPASYRSMTLWAQPATEL